MLLSKPRSLSEVKNIGKKKADLRAYLTSHANMMEAPNKYVLFSGPPGIGKSAVAKLCAKEWNFDPIIINMSEGAKSRLDDAIENAMTLSISSEQRAIVILEEVDGLTGQHRKIINKLRKISDEIPVIMTCNEDWIVRRNMRDVFNNSLVIEFKRPDNRMMLRIAQRMNEEYDIGLKYPELSKVVKKAKGDIRNIQKLMTAYLCGEASPINISVTDANIFSVLLSIYHRDDQEKIVRDVFDAGIKLDKLFNFLSANVFKYSRLREDCYENFDTMASIEPLVNDAMNFTKPTPGLYRSVLATLAVCTEGGGDAGFVRFDPPQTWSKLPKQYESCYKIISEIIHGKREYSLSNIVNELPALNQMMKNKSWRIVFVRCLFDHLKRSNFPKSDKAKKTYFNRIMSIMDTGNMESPEYNELWDCLESNSASLFTRSVRKTPHGIDDITDAEKENKDEKDKKDESSEVSIDDALSSF